MTNRRIDLVLVKLGAVVILIMALAGLANYLVYLNTLRLTAVTAIGFLFTFVAPILIAAALWLFPSTVVGKIELESSPEYGDADFILLGVTLIGLYAFVFGVIDLVYFEALRHAEQQAIDPERTAVFAVPSPHAIAGRYTNLVQIVIGLGLLVGKRQIARLLRRARYTA